MDGILPVWKSVGVTSFQVTRTVKHVLARVEPGKIRIGHAGTLDPFAEGVLIIMIGKATKRFDELQKWPKTYRAVAWLGGKSDTLDVTGKIEKVENPKIKLVVAEAQREANKLVGEIEQEIPQYSAAKYKGKPRYKYARKAEIIPEKKKKVTIYSIKVVKVEKDEVEFVTTCSSGTYIRQLSYDLFRSLGIESYLIKLTREAVGPITRENCLTIEQATDVDMVARQVRPVLDGLDF